MEHGLGKSVASELSGGRSAEEIFKRIDTTIPHPARVYDYLLGGKDNFAADRAAAEQLIAVSPGVREGVRAHRAFLRRAVRYLAAEAGMKQFLDIGTGIPTQGNTHEVAQEIVPEARVAYVDNDPIVLVHGRALLTSHPAGKTTVIEADLRRPEEILAHPDVRDTIDFSRPVALILAGVLHFLTDEEDPHGVVERLKAAVPSGSHLLLSHVTLDFAPGVSQEEAGKPVLANAVRGLPAVGGGLHATVLGDRPQAVDDPQHRHVRAEPAQVQSWVAGDGEGQQEDRLHAEDAPGRPARGRGRCRSSR